MKAAWSVSLVCTPQTDLQAAEGTCVSFWLPLFLIENMEMWFFNRDISIHILIYFIYR